MDQLQLIQNRIYEFRGQKVMLDHDLAEMYGVQTKVLNQAVKRNIERIFPLSMEKYLLIIFKGRFTSLFYMDSYQDQALIDSPENLPHKEHLPIEAHYLQNPSYHPHP